MKSPYKIKGEIIKRKKNRRVISVKGLIKINIRRV